ncbi:UNVERIFIED_CONTAM: hypothetical protein HDU68_002893 [Siphonaria sp. JEL0065]|nr:hypothetical protein HDU68_002893 [Siphonaria sp. JEL0065]
MHAVLNALGVQSSIKTHMHRHATRENEELDVLPEDQKNRSGRWNKSSNSGEAVYAPQLPTPAMKCLGGHKSDAQFYLRRGILEPSASLVSKYWDGRVEMQRENISRNLKILATNHESQGDISGTGCLNLFEALAVSGMQDFVAAEEEGFFNISQDPAIVKLHSSTTDAFWKDAEFLEFKENLLIAMAAATTPEQNILQNILPGLSTDLQALTSEVSLSSTRISDISTKITSGFSKLHAENAAVLGKMDHILHGFQIVGTALNLAFNGLSVPVLSPVSPESIAPFDMRSLLQEFLNSDRNNNDELSENGGDEEPGGEGDKCEGIPVRQDTNHENPNSQLPDINAFVHQGKFLSRSYPHDVEKLYEEFKRGFSGKPSVMWMETTFGTRWRDNTETQYYTVRKVVVERIDLLMAEAMGRGLDETSALKPAIKTVDVERNGRSNDKYGKELRRKRARSE